MADEQGTELETTEEIETEESNEELDEIENEATDESNTEVEEEFSVEIEGEESQETEEEKELKAAPQWVKDLRKKNRELEKELKEAREKVASGSEKVAELGVKPKLDDEDIDYDTSKYEVKLAEWFERKRKIEEEEEKKQTEIKQQQTIWEGKLKSYNDGKAKLPVKDHAEVEDQVKMVLSPIQQSMIIRCSENPALLVYAIGKNESTLKKLSGIKDHAEFAYTLGKLEAKLKTSSKRPVTTPEKTVTGSAPSSGVTDKQLAKLQAEAEKTGDLTKVIAYKRKLRRNK